MPYKKKCFSTCSEFEKSECNPPRCKYVVGKTQKYCRLSIKYKMNKPTCNVTRRIKKGDVEKVALTKIGQMIKKSGKFLKVICSDSGVCIAFGRKANEITQFFKGFVDFEYALSPLHKIGGVSANGFIKEIDYEREGYKAHAILKSAQNPRADNLVYEYLVGLKYINRIINRFPCFLQTYGLYFYNSDVSWKIMQGLGPVHKANLKNLTLQTTIDYTKTCRDSQYAAVLIQHIKNARTLYSHYLEPPFLKKDLLYTLFILYHALHSLRKTFTHYDFHHENVLLYEPVKGKYIQYNYHNLDGTTTSFYSPYIPKIIDYGRSYFDNSKMNSKKIYEKVCQTGACNPHCGDDYGFQWLEPESEYFITSSKKNESHDLRLMNMIKVFMKDVFSNGKNVIPEGTTFSETYKLIKKIKYGVGVKRDDYKEFGTQEDLSSGNRIFNVTGAYEALKTAIEMPEIVAENESNYKIRTDKLGDLHIYNDGRPMVYEPI